MYFLVVSAVVAVWSGANYHLQYFRLRFSRLDRAEGANN
jgi:hypothetical protein